MAVHNCRCLASTQLLNEASQTLPHSGALQKSRHTSCGFSLIHITHFHPLHPGTTSSMPRLTARGAVCLRDCQLRRLRLCRATRSWQRVWTVIALNHLWSAHRPCHTDTQTITDASHLYGILLIAMWTQKTTQFKPSDRIKSAVAIHQTDSCVLNPNVLRDSIALYMPGTYGRMKNVLRNSLTRSTLALPYLNRHPWNYSMVHGHT